MNIKITHPFSFVAVFFTGFFMFFALVMPPTVHAANPPGTAKYQCGKKNNEGGSIVKTKFNLGCLGEQNNGRISPIEDLLYAILRFLSLGVGLIVVVAIIASGIQYATSEGNPEATSAAKGRIQNAVIGLFFYLITFALIQFLVPGGLFTGTMMTPVAIGVFQ